MVMTDYWGLLSNAFTAPARGMTAMPPKANLGGGLLEMLHNKLDPVQAFGGYGALAAMALPPGVRPKVGASFESLGSDLGTLYHAGKSKVVQVDPAKLQSRDSGFYGKGFYTATDPKFTKGYGSKVSKFELPKDSYVLDASLKASEAAPELVAAVKQDYLKSGLEAARARGKEAAFMDEVNAIGSDHLAWKNAVSRFAERNGYDAVRYSPGEVVVTNTSKLVAKK